MTSVYTIQPFNFTLADSFVPYERGTLLEQYFNDLYKMFMAKMALTALGTALNDSDKNRLKNLFYELIRVRELIDEAE